MAKNKKLEKTEKTENGPSNKEIVGLFRHLWIQSMGCPNYKKNEWKQLEEMLTKKGITI